MMNRLSKLLIILVVLAMLAGCFTACGVVDSLFNKDGEDVTDTDGGKNEGDGSGDGEVEIEFVDYASQVKFNPNSGRKWAKVKVKSYIDGDTTHFETIDGTQIGELDYVKARYLSINTPESTGVIEPWGKKASNFTKEHLKQATEIIIESDSDKWDLDSTGGRYLLWIWYKTAEDTDYRNLNLEILQEGLAYGSNVSSNVYGQIAFKILSQSKNLKLHVFNKNVKDPDFYYGKDAVNTTLKELKASIIWDAEKDRYVSEYEGLLVKFEAVVAVADTDASTFYVEEYDEDTGVYYGMQIFTYSSIKEIFVVGNRVSVVGTLQYYENGNTYQISNLEFDTLDPNWVGGCRIISTGHSSSYLETDVSTLLNGTVELELKKTGTDENGDPTEEYYKKEYKYAELAHYTSVAVKNLTVTSIYTTEKGESKGALTITCRDENGNTIAVRTNELFYQPGGGYIPVTEADFPIGTTISVRGIVDYFNGKYQVKVFKLSDITFE